MAEFEVAMTGAGNYRFRVVYTVTPQSGGVLVAVTSQWMRVGGYNGEYNNSAPYSLTIGGFGTKSGTRQFNGSASGWQWIESTSVLFTSGAQTSITATFNTGTQQAGSGSIASLTVPIATASQSSFTTVGGPAITAFDAGQQITIHTNRKSTAFTHNLIVSFGGVYETIATGVLGSYNWTPPLSLLTKIPSATSGTGFIRTETYQGSTFVGRLDTVFTLRAGAGVVPSVTGLSFVERNSSVASIVGMPVQSLSRVRLTVSGAGAYGSSLTAATATLLGSTVPSGGEVAISQAGALTASARVTDTRGRSGTWSGALLTALPYTPPVVASYLARRSNASGVVQDSGEHLRIDLNAYVQSLVNGTQRNKLTIRVHTRPRGGSVWTPRNVIEPTGLTYNTNVVISGGGIFTDTSSWDVRVQVQDRFATYTADTTVATASVALDLYGKNVGVGKIWEQGALDVGGPIYSNNDLVLTRGNVSSGLWGNGGNGATQRVPGNDMNLAVQTGFYYADGTTLNVPNSSHWWNVIVENAGSRCTQTVTRLEGADQVYKRWQANGVWQPWQVLAWQRPATQAEVNTGGDNRLVVTTQTLRNRNYAPYSEAAGRATSSASGAVTVTFPAGRFSQPPRVNITPGNHANVLVPRIAANPTATSCQVQLFTLAGGLVAAAFDWSAVQMAAGSGSG